MIDMNAEIISIGTELLLGHVINTNASFLSEKLAEASDEIALAIANEVGMPLMLAKGIQVGLPTMTFADHAQRAIFGFSRRQARHSTARVRRCFCSGVRPRFIPHSSAPAGRPRRPAANSPGA